MATNYYGGDETNIQEGGGFGDYYGGGNNDQLTSDETGFHNMYGGEGNDLVGLTLGAAGSVYGGNGVDIVFGATNADPLYGGEGGDILVGGASIENGGEPDPVGRSGDDGLEGGGGADGLYGFDGNDALFGGEGDDQGTVAVVISGVPFAFRAGLFGGDGQDTLDGGRGNDLLDGGAAKDLLIGGLGRDVFEYRAVAESAGSARDVIRDFHASEHDLIDLHAIDANTHKSGNQPFKFLTGAAFDHAPAELIFHGGSVLGDIDGNGKADLQIALPGVAHLHASDFIL